MSVKTKRIKCQRCDGHGQVAAGPNYPDECPDCGGRQTMEGEFPSLDEAYDAAVRAVSVFDDAANVEETNWTGWGDQIVPASAEMRRVKAGHALSALRDADPRRYAVVFPSPPKQGSESNG